MNKPTSSEKFVIHYFSDEFGVALQRITEGAERTPDFEFMSGGARRFIAELKTLEDCPTTPKFGWTNRTDKHGIRRATRNDNSVARVARAIHSAVEQLAQYTEPRVLIILNEDGFADVHDLEEAFNGAMVYCNSNLAYLNIASRRIAKGDIRDEKWIIDLYIWIQRRRKVSTYFRPVTAMGHELACKVFAAAPLPDID